MKNNPAACSGEEPVAACSLPERGMKGAVVSWAMPLAAIAVLIAGMYLPVLRVFNIFFAAFGISVLVRSVAHMRVYGVFGLGGQLAVGASLNLAIVILVIAYLFTGLDPIHIRP